jgi:hypothetical protein
LLLVILMSLPFCCLSQSDSLQSDSSQAHLLPSFRHVVNTQPLLSGSFKVDLKARALFCRMEAGLRKKTGVDWNIGMDVR